MAHRTRPEFWLDLSESGGWDVSVPPTPAARDLLDLYVPLICAPDLVIGQLGQSLDGRIATVGGKSHYITGPEDIRRLHRLRALVDAVIVGAEAVARDDPQLTVRDVEGENPLRVVLDPDGRLGEDRWVFSDRAARTLVVRRETADGGVNILITTMGEVRLLEIRVAVASDMDGFPLSESGVPKLGLFPHSGTHRPPATSTSYQISVAAVDLVSGELLMSVQASVMDGSQVEHGAWPVGTRFRKQGNPATYFSIPVPDRR